PWHSHFVPRAAIPCISCCRLLFQRDRILTFLRRAITPSYSPRCATRASDLPSFKEIISTSPSWRRVGVEIRTCGAFFCIYHCLLPKAPCLPSRTRNRKPFFRSPSCICLLSSFFNRETDSPPFSTFRFLPWSDGADPLGHSSICRAGNSMDMVHPEATTRSNTGSVSVYFDNCSVDNPYLI